MLTTQRVSIPPMLISVPDTQSAKLGFSSLKVTRFGTLTSRVLNDIFVLVIKLSMFVLITPTIASLLFKIELQNLSSPLAKFSATRYK